MAMSGYALRDHTLNTLLDDQDDLIYDWLDQHGVTWRVYSEGWPFFALMHKVRRRMLADIWSHYFRGFVALTHDIDKGDVPQVVFIEPDYTDGPEPEKGDDDHPTTSIARGQDFLKRVYEAVSHNSGIWSKSLLIIAYDEHGGFFDHVRPIPLVLPQRHGETYKPFTTTGIRVPAILASPFVEPKRAFNGTLDHTSILKLLAEKYSPGKPYSDDVAARVNIQSLSAALTGTSSVPEPAPTVPAINDLPTESSPLPPQRMLSPNQLAFRNMLEEARQTDPEAAARKFPQWSSFFLRGR
jgi:phospholipase C